MAALNQNFCHIGFSSASFLNWAAKIHVESRVQNSRLQTKSGDFGVIPEEGVQGIPGWCSDRPPKIRTSLPPLEQSSHPTTHIHPTVTLAPTSLNQTLTAPRDKKLVLSPRRKWKKREAPSSVEVVDGLKRPVEPADGPVHTHLLSADEGGCKKYTFRKYKYEYRYKYRHKYRYKYKCNYKYRRAGPHAPAVSW